MSMAEASSLSSVVSGLLRAGTDGRCGPWIEQGRLEEAKSEVVRAIDIRKQLGVSGGLLEDADGILQEIEEKKNNR